MKKKFIAIALAALSMFTFSACGTDSGSGGGIPDSTGTLNKDGGGNVIFDNVSIRLTTVVAGEDWDAFNTQIQTFNMIYDGKINVIVDKVPQGTYETSVGNRIINDTNSPDIIMSHQKSHKSFQVDKLIRPIDGVMTESNIVLDMNNYAPGLAQYSKLGTSNMYSVPADAQSLVVLYNKSMLSDLNASLPTNRTELLNLCSQVKTSKGVVPIAWDTSSDFFSTYLFTTAVLQNDGVLYDSSNYKVDWSSNPTNKAAIKNAVDSVKELISLGYANNAESSSSGLQRFLNNQAMFYVVEPWSVKKVIESYATRWGKTVEETTANYIGGTSMCGWYAKDANSANANKIFGDSHFFAVTKNCVDINKQAACLEFMRWFTQDADTGAKWAEAGHISASKIIDSNATYNTNSFVQNYISKFYGSIDNFTCLGTTPYYLAVSAQLSTLIVSMINPNTQSSFDSLIQSAEDTVNNEIDFFG